jgi:hypothetical protein
MRKLRVMFYCTSEHEKAQAERVVARLGSTVDPVMAGVPFGPSAVATAGNVRAKAFPGAARTWEWRLVLRARRISHDLPLPLRIVTALPFLVAAAMVSFARRIVLGRRARAVAPPIASLVAFVFGPDAAAEARIHEMARRARFLASRAGIRYMYRVSVWRLRSAFHRVRRHVPAKRLLLALIVPWAGKGRARRFVHRIERGIKSVARIPSRLGRPHRRLVVPRYIARRRRVLAMVGPWGGRWQARRRFYTVRRIVRFPGGVRIWIAGLRGRRVHRARLRNRVVRRRVLGVIAPSTGKWAARRHFYRVRNMHRLYRKHRPHWITLFAHLKETRALKGEFATLLSDQAPDALVLFEDNVGGWTRIIAGAAVDQQIAYFVLPLTIPNPKEPAAFYRGQSGHMISGALARSVATRWPKWTYEHEGMTMLRLPPPDILSMHFLRLDPPQPWVLNSGSAEAICIESEAMLRHYRALGFAEGQLVVTGSLVDDTLDAVYRERQARREALLTEHGLDAGRPLFVVGFPPDQYTSPDTSPFEFESFEELIEGWRAALAPVLPHANVVVKPHPRLPTWRLGSLKAAGLIVTTAPTEELVPLADVYIASISATIRWALALGVPVVNYDCYRYRYGDFDAAAGLATIEQLPEFQSAVMALAADPAHRAAMSARQAADARNWGVIDGHFGDRLLHLLHERVRIRESGTPPARQFDQDVLPTSRASISVISDRIAEGQPSA